MAEENKAVKLPHHLIVEERHEVSVAGVIEVISFDESTVLMNTSLGELVIRGYDLHITRTDVSSGELLLTGEICELLYSSNRPTGGTGLLNRLFRSS